MRVPKGTVVGMINAMPSDPLLAQEIVTIWVVKRDESDSTGVLYSLGVNAEGLALEDWNQALSSSNTFWSSVNLASSGYNIADSWREGGLMNWPRYIQCQMTGGLGGGQKLLLDSYKFEFYNRRRRLRLCEP